MPGPNLIDAAVGGPRGWGGGGGPRPGTCRCQDLHRRGAGRSPAALAGRSGPAP